MAEVTSNSRAVRLGWVRVEKRREEFRRVAITVLDGSSRSVVTRERPNPVAVPVTVGTRRSGN